MSLQFDLLLPSEQPITEPDPVRSGQIRSELDPVRLSLILKLIWQCGRPDPDFLGKPDPDFLGRPLRIFLAKWNRIFLGKPDPVL